MELPHQELVDRLEQASMRFYHADKLEESAVLMRVANALRDMPPGLVDDVLDWFKDELEKSRL